MRENLPDSHDNDRSGTRPGIINESAEVADMNAAGVEAYHKAKQARVRRHSILFFTGVILSVFGIVIGPFWLVFAAAVSVASLIELLSPGPDVSALAAGRLAEHDPPEQLSWEEHVRKYGHRDGEPLSDDELDEMFD